MLYGIANLGICSNNLTATNSVRGFNIFSDLCISSFSMEGSSNSRTATCWRGGKKQVIASAVTDETYTVNLSIEQASWSAMQVAYGELAQDTPLRLPTTVEYQVPTTGGLTITQSDITITNANAASVRVFDQTKEIFLVPSTGAPAANQFQVIPASSNIVLNATQQGSNIFYIYDKVYTSASNIGRSGGDFLTEFSLTGRLSSTIYGNAQTAGSGVGIFIPRLAPISIPSLTIDGALEVQYQALLAPGYQRPFVLTRLDTAV